MKIVNTDNFGGDYPDEWFLRAHFGSKERAEKVAALLNEEEGGDYTRRYWKVVEDDYVLQPGFEP